MSMLAEPKRKQKWSLNPRGKDWSEDSNKFGQKLLEKMGWSQGKGLGAQENGITEHVKLAYKNDSKGMGYKEQTEQWTEHEDNFASLLDSLTRTVNGNTEETEETALAKLKSASLEAKSQNSKARVHYHKFTRGKDLSRYSEKDLANIFGKKSLKEKKKAAEEIVQQVADADQSNLRNSGSMVDYFKSKLPNFSLSSSYTIGSNGVLTKASENEDQVEEKPKKKRKIKDNDSIQEAEDSTTYETPTKKKKKSRNDSFALDNPNFVDEFNTSEVNTEIVTNNFEIKRKAKKSKQFTNTEEGFENSGFNPDTSLLQSEKSEAEQFEVKRKVKKSKKSKISEEGIDNPILNLDISDSAENGNDSVFSNANAAENFEVKRKTKKLKKRENIDGGIDNPNLTLNNSDSLENGAENSNSHTEVNADNFEVKRKSKKLKKRENIDGGIDNPNLTLNNSDSLENGVENSNSHTEVNADNFEVKRKSKKLKKRENIAEGIDNPSLTLNDSNYTENETEGFNSNMETTVDTFEVKKKSKKSKKKENVAEGIDNPNLTLNDSDYQENENIEISTTTTFEVKRKSKKNKRTQEGLDNPCLNLDTSESLQSETINEQLDADLNCDIMLNVTNTPIKPTLKTAKSTTQNRRKSVHFSEVNEEHIIPNNQGNRNELFDINTEIISRSIVEQAKKTGIIENTNFDLKSIDEINFCESGVQNKAFDSIGVKMQENIAAIEETIDSYQAEVENDLNEAKIKKIENCIIPIGKIGSSGKNEKLSIGTRLKYKDSKFGKIRSNPKWEAQKNISACKAKKTYKHLIRGDVIVQFLNTNLHEIKGYAYGKTYNKEEIVDQVKEFTAKSVQLTNEQEARIQRYQAAKDLNKPRLHGSGYRHDQFNSNASKRSPRANGFSPRFVSKGEFKGRAGFRGKPWSKKV